MLNTIIAALFAAVFGATPAPTQPIRASQVKCFTLGKFGKSPKSQWPVAVGQCVASKKPLSCEHKASTYYLCTGDTRAMSNKLPEAAFKACNCPK